MIIKIGRKKIIQCGICYNKFAYEEKDIQFKDLPYVPVEGGFPYIECPYCHTFIAI